MLESLSDKSSKGFLTVLMRDASRRGDLQSIKFLVCSGADSTDFHALECACFAGHSRVVKYLVSHGAQPRFDSEDSVEEFKKLVGRL